MQASRATSTGVWIALTVSMGHFFNDAFTALLTPLGPDIAKRFDTNIASIAFLGFVLSLTGSVLQPVYGVIAERFNRRVVVSIGPVLAGIGMSLMGYMPHFAFLVVLMAVAGIGSGLLHPTGAAYVAQYSDPNKRGLWASIFSAGGTAGMALGPLFASQLGLHGLPWLIPVAVVVGIISYLICPDAKTVSKQNTPLSEYVKVFKGPMVGLWAMGVLRSLASVSYNSLLPFILEAKHYPKSAMGLALACYSVGSAVGGIVAGRLSDKYGRVAILRSSIWAVIPMYVLLMNSEPKHWWYYPLSFVVGAFTNSTIPVAVVTAQEYAPKYIGLASSLMMGFSWGVSGLLFLLIGIIADHTTPIFAMMVGVAMFLPSAWIASRLPEPKKVSLG